MFIGSTIEKIRFNVAESALGGISCVRRRVVHLIFSLTMRDPFDIYLVMIGNRAVFLDRDGVLNDLVFNPATAEFESPLTVSAVNLIEGVPDAVKQLSAAGFALFIISNQPNFAKRKSTMEDLRAIAQCVRSMFETKEVQIAHEYYCYHHPNGIVPEFSIPCDCRKPGNKFIFDACAQYGLDLSQCWMIGDQDSDIACGCSAGCRTILIENPHSAHGRTSFSKPTLSAKNLKNAVAMLLSVAHDPLH